MKQPHIDDYESVEEYEEAERCFDDYIDSKIDERKEDAYLRQCCGISLEDTKNSFKKIPTTSLINENTLNELKRLNKEIEGDLKDGN